MSSAQSLNIAQAMDIVIGFHTETTFMADDISDDAVGHLITLGFPVSLALLSDAAEELVKKTHRDYKINALHTLRTSVALVRCSGGLNNLVDQVETSLNLGEDVVATVNQLAVICRARPAHMSSSQLQMLERLLLEIEGDLCKAGEAIGVIIDFIDAKGEHLKLLGHLQEKEHFDRITSSLREPPLAQELAAVARDALDVLRPTLYEPFSVADRSGEEVERVVAELQSLDVGQLNRSVLDEKMAGLVRIRDELGVLQEAQPVRLAAFSQALKSPVAVPTSIRDEAFDVDLEILDATAVSSTLAQADGTMKEIVGGAKALLQRLHNQFAVPGVHDLPQE
ncbi:uncharacterized protein TRAVEDRAFT_54897 [Trametes versicolor FP-101664 SS1]|uniref:Uncharacterized protein n=1 Tax=Trametes versicolor (strain FP-101664) TaxID=717944 RepID=R7S6F1_TRAVS|nr:uncharacterized protein TRAVEDRAFT_54897 [Trametes versicolor FP-101664 SS1]EIW51105.1 hypothetical protein TRAVEDRAFT_54897 [Trametes versicolor FP-101664 SS1]